MLLSGLVERMRISNINIKHPDVIEICITAALVIWYFIEVHFDSQLEQIVQTALIIMAIGTFSLTDGRGIITKFLSLKTNIFLSLLSYNFFIFHFVVITCGGEDIALKLFDEYGDGGLFVGCILIFFVTIIASIVFQAVQNRIYNYRYISSS